MSELLDAMQLNTIAVKRTSLSSEEAEAVWLLRWSGDKQHTIAAKLGVNAGRVADVLTEKTHQGSKLRAHSKRSG